MRGIYLVLLISLFLIPSSHAEIAALHQGSNDPSNEGWTRYRPFLSVNTFPVRNDLGAGIDAWSIDDNAGFGPPGHDGAYGVLLDSAQLFRAEGHGWRFSVQMRIVESPEGEAQDAIICGVTGTSQNWTMHFGRKRNANPVVRLISNDVEVDVEVKSPRHVYHLYELVFTPSQATVQLFVDKELRETVNVDQPKKGNTDIDRGKALPELGNIYFGSTSNNLAAQANYALVKFEIGEASDHKSPIPTGDLYVVAAKAVHDVYELEIEKARNKAQKVQLGQKFLEDGIETTDDDNGRYVLLQMAWQLAADNGDIDTALIAIDALETRYDIDGLALKTQTLTNLSKTVRDNDPHRRIASMANESLAEALSADRYGLAVSRPRMEPVSKLGLVLPIDQPGSFAEA